MADRLCENGIKEAVCIHTNKIYDTCKDRDCIENTRVYLTNDSQAILDKSINVKPKNAELLWAYIDVEDLPFNRGCYTVDVKFFYKITGDAFCGMSRPQEICGLATYDKRVVLYGSEGNAKIYSSKTGLDCVDDQMMVKTNMPTAVVEAVDPILLDIDIVENCCHCNPCGNLTEIPERICRCFCDRLVMDNEGRTLRATLGQFSMIRLERDTQLLIPSYDFCIPQKECVSSNDDKPCDLFRKIAFPIDEFFPPKSNIQVDTSNKNCNCK